MLSHVFMNGLQSDVFLLDEKVDPNLIKVLPDYMNNLSQRKFQQPAMIPDVVKEGFAYEYQNQPSFSMGGHPDGCQCPECRKRREIDHVAIYQDLAYMQNAQRKFCIDLNSYAFDTQSTKDYNHTMALLRLHNQNPIPVLSNTFFIKLNYTLISIDSDGSVITTQDNVIQTQALRHYYMTNDQDKEGFWTYQFLDLHNSDVITIPTMYGASEVSLNLRSIEVIGRSNGYSLEVKPDGSLVYVNTGIKDYTLFKDTFGIEYRGYAYPVQPHDRIQINFSVVFNNMAFMADITDLRDTMKGLDYRTCDFDTVPSWNGIHLWTDTDIQDDHFIPVADSHTVQDTLEEKLSQIPLPEVV